MLDWIEEIQKLAAGCSAFFQKVEVEGFSVMIEFQQHQVDMAALWARQPVEFLNLVPWGGLHLSLPTLTLKGVQGWPALLASILGAWLDHINSTQVTTSHLL